MAKAIKYVLVRVEMNLNDKNTGGDVINECVYSFTSTIKGCTITDTEIVEVYDKSPE